MSQENKETESETTGQEDQADSSATETTNQSTPTEIGGRKGPEPVRYGDWEKNGRCIDF